MRVFGHYHKWGKWHYVTVDRGKRGMHITAVRVCRRGNCRAEQVH